MTENIKKITEGTLIPISLVITFAGGIVWLSAIWYREEANAASISEIKQNLKDDRSEFVRKIDKINEKLDYIIERLPR